jgi:glyoxalase family protein
VDRNYFHSIYNREPAGVHFGIATDIPGFTIGLFTFDALLPALGTARKLSRQYESHRTAIEAHLPKLH